MNKSHIRGKVSKNTKPGIERSIEIACKRLSWKALKVLEAALDNDKIDMKVRLQAATEIFNRGWGRPKQSIDQTVNLGGGEALLEAITHARKRVTEAKELPPISQTDFEVKDTKPTIN